jgi:hypothetical protein
MRAAGQFFSGHARMQQVLQADSPQQFGSHAIRDAVDDLRAVLRRIDVHAERTVRILGSARRIRRRARVREMARDAPVMTMTCFMIVDSCNRG